MHRGQETRNYLKRFRKSLQTAPARNTHRSHGASRPGHHSQREPERVTAGAGEGLVFLKVVTERHSSVSFKFWSMMEVSRWTASERIHVYNMMMSILLKSD